MTYPTKPPHHQRSSDQRIVITGMGLVSPLGLDVESSWQAVLAGKSGVALIDHFDTSDYRCKIAATVSGFDATQYMSAKDARRYDDFVHYALAATSQALQQADLIDCPDGKVQGINTNRIGAIIGSGIGGLPHVERSHQTLLSKGAGRVSPFFVPAAIINMPAGLAAIRHGLNGLNLATATACATATHAIGLAARLIAYGDADVIVTGGSERASSPLALAGFAAMKALSTQNDTPQQASRPFDRGRDGFVLGDGAGVIVIERLSHAQARGATILAELSGFGMGDDAHHITAPSDNGEGAYRAMQLALDDAGISAHQIGYINAHATSTPLGDIAESIAIERLFGRDTAPPVSSTKSMTGHLLGAAGGVEAIFTLLSLQRQCLPPTINLTIPDPQCRLDYIPNQCRKATHLNHALSNSFGFGGTNGSLLFSRWSA